VTLATRFSVRSIRPGLASERVAVASGFFERLAEYLLKDMNHERHGRVAVIEAFA